MRNSVKQPQTTDGRPFRFKKGLGQHFLIDERVRAKIIGACKPEKDDLIIEIGPGAGFLTEVLAERAGKVCAIEIDGELIPILNEAFAEYKNVEIIRTDALKADFGAIIKNSGMRRAKVATNLPYNIATAVITTLFEKRLAIESATVMVQKEVAARLCAAPGAKNYGSLSLFIQYRSEPYLVANVPVNCFTPRPRVDSAVVKLAARVTPPVPVTDEDFFFKLIRAAFSHRRKTLVNCLSDSEIIFTGRAPDKKKLEGALEAAGLPKMIRGEMMSMTDFAALCGVLYDAFPELIRPPAPS